MSKSISISETNQRVVSEFNEAVFEHHDLDNLEEYLATDVVQYIGGNSIRGIEANRDYFDRTLESFSDMEMEILELAATGDWVLFRFSASGTNDGVIHMDEETTLEATGEDASWEGFVSIRCEDGKIVETHMITDWYTLFDQLGLAEEYTSVAA